MTLKKFHKLLGDLIEKGHGRRRVCVDKRSFSHPLEDDGAVILDVESTFAQVITMVDDNGFTKYRKNGEECRHGVIVISGESSNISGLARPEQEKTS